MLYVMLMRLFHCIQLFDLEDVVSLENCRIVKYDEYNEHIELSYDGQEVGFEKHPVICLYLINVWVVYNF